VDSLFIKLFRGSFRILVEHKWILPMMRWRTFLRKCIAPRFHSAAFGHSKDTSGSRGGGIKLGLDSSWLRRVKLWNPPRAFRATAGHIMDNPSVFVNEIQRHPQRRAFRTLRLNDLFLSWKKKIRKGFDVLKNAVCTSKLDDIHSKFLR